MQLSLPRPDDRGVFLAADDVERSRKKWLTEEKQKKAVKKAKPTKK
jgi:hypothetical protein